MLVILGVIGAIFTAFCIIRFNDRLNVKPALIPVAAIVHVLYAFAAVRVFGIIDEGSLSGLSHMRVFGNTFFLPMLYYLFSRGNKRTVADVFDVGTLALLFALMIAPINCMLKGCCFGIPFFGMENFRWPTRIIEMLFYAILLPILWRRTEQGKSNGLNFPIYMISYGAYRFVFEFVRYDGLKLFHRAHIWSMLTLILGISVYVEIKNKQQSKQKTKPKKQKNRR